MHFGHKARVIITDSDGVVQDIFERDFKVRKDGCSKQLTDLILDSTLQMCPGDTMEVILNNPDGSWR